MPLNEGMKIVQQLFTDLLRIEDTREGPLAFAHKRKPIIEGQVVSSTDHYSTLQNTAFKYAVSGIAILMG